MQPLQLYGGLETPNPFKVAIILEELGVPYTLAPVGMSELKQEPYLRVNPNGRSPALKDPNHDVTIWESGAIIEYLIQNYDEDGKISYSSGPEKWLTMQWLFFQASGQGPYMGQGVWFIKYHPEKLPTAQERYVQETRRIIGVISKALEGKDWLVGDKCTYADLSFIAWFVDGPKYFGDHWKLDAESEFPNYHGWLGRMMEMASVRAAYEKRA